MRLSMKLLIIGVFICSGLAFAQTHYSEPDIRGDVITLILGQAFDQDDGNVSILGPDAADSTIQFDNRFSFAFLAFRVACDSDSVNITVRQRLVDSAGNVATADSTTTITTRGNHVIPLIRPGSYREYIVFDANTGNSGIAAVTIDEIELTRVR